MKKRYLELQYLEEKKIKEYLKQIDGVKDSYKLTSIYNTISIVCFILNLLVIMVAGVCEYLIIDLNSLITNILILGLSLSALICLIISLFYKNKTFNMLDNYYEKEINM